MSNRTASANTRDTTRDRMGREIPSNRVDPPGNTRRPWEASPSSSEWFILAVRRFVLQERRRNSGGPDPHARQGVGFLSFTHHGKGAGEADPITYSLIQRGPR